MMAYINLSNGGYKCIAISKGFWNSLDFKKARKQFTCLTCHEKRSSGTRYISEISWSGGRICMFCIDEWVKNSEGVLELIRQRINDSKKLLNDNKSVWFKEAMAGSIKG
jgi:hypothetical protein